MVSEVIFHYRVNFMTTTFTVPLKTNSILIFSKRANKFFVSNINLFHHEHSNQTWKFTMSLDPISKADNRRNPVIILSTGEQIINDVEKSIFALYLKS